MEWNSLLNQGRGIKKDTKYHRFHTRTSVVQTIIYKRGLD